MKPNKSTVATKKVKVSCMERVAIAQLLQTYKEGNFITFKILAGLRLKVAFTALEVNEFELKEANNQVQWNTQGQLPKEFLFDEGEIKLIRDQLLALDKESKLTSLYVSIYELFV